jgi:hypothetical protein
MQPFNALAAELVGGPRDGERIQLTDPSTKSLDLADPSALPDPGDDDDIVNVALDQGNRLIYVREGKWIHDEAGVYVAKFRIQQ